MQFCFKAHQMIARLIYEKNLELGVRLTSKKNILNQIYIQRNIENPVKFSWSKFCIHSG